MHLDRAALGRLRDRARLDVDAGLAHGGIEGATLSVAFENEILWEEGFGAAKATTPIMMLSITKTVVEAALWRLFGQGLDPETPVIDLIPSFMGGTQPDITIAMVETHRAGFAWHPLHYAEGRDRSARLAAFERWRLERAPGFYEYNPINGAWVLAEIIETVSGRDFRAFVKDEILTPLGLGTPSSVSLGESAEDLAEVLLHRNYMAGYTPDPSLRAPMAWGLDTIEGLSLGTPGVAGVGTASGIARLYQAFLHNPGEIWNPVVLREARDRTRVAMPDNFGRPMQRSLSFVQAGRPEDRYGERTFFGPAVSSKAFGHQGQGGQIAWADPATGLSFAYLTNTVVFPPGGSFHPRARDLSGLAATLLS